VVLYGSVAYVAVRELQPFLSREVSERRSRVVKLTLIPYLAGGLAFCAAVNFPRLRGGDIADEIAEAIANPGDKPELFQLMPI
jgi:hypothetical protein